MLALPETRAICNKSNFGSTTIAKGVRYASQGRVLNSNVTVEGNIITVNALVSGSQRRPYKVNVDIKIDGRDIQVDGECSCPIGYNCKHVVASIAAACGATPKENGVVARMVPVAKSAPPPPALSPALAAWTRSLAPPATAPGIAPEQQLRFMLDLDITAWAKRTRLTLGYANRKKSGEFGKPTRCNFYGSPRELLQQPLYQQDRDLLVQLFGIYGCNSEQQLEGQAGSELLTRILSTGRCCWGPGKKPVSLGPARPAKAIWREEPDGTQTAAFEVEGGASALLPLAPPWYVDDAAGICGPLQVDVAPEIALKWLNAPAVNPEETPALAQAVAGFPIPAPRRVQVKERRNLRPKPVLHLKQLHFSRPQRLYYTGAGPRPQAVSELAVATIAFDYDGARVRENDNSSFVARRAGDVIERISRMPRVENNFVWAVDDSGLGPTDRLLYSYRVEEAEDTYSFSTREEWLEWMIEALPELQKAGWIIEIDPDFPYRPADIQEWYTETETSGIDWFSYELGIVVDGDRINLLPMIGDILNLLSKKEREQGHRLDTVHWTLPTGKIAAFPADRLRAIAATLAELFDPEAFSGGKLQVNRLRAAELINLNDDTPWRGPAELQQLRRQLNSFDRIRPVVPPKSLAATLRPYQLEGLSWLQFLREHNFSGILADDMGLGKTVQAIAHIALEREAGRATAPSLVIAPTSLMPNWRAEAEKFAPELKVLILHGGGRKERFDEIPAHDLVVTSYALLTKDREILEKQNFHLVILDEAQYIKNAKTQWAEICRSLKAGHRLCMTGTPMENHLGELWSLMHFLSPGYLGSEKQFRRIYRDPIEKAGDTARRSALAKRIRPFIMRRRKEEVAAELPEKTEIVRNVEIDGKQRDLYETIRIAMHERVRAEVEKKGLARSHIVILDALLKLRQVCCDPRLVKLERAKTVRNSAKLDLLKEMLPEMISEGRRVLLFSQFTSMLDLIENAVVPMEIPFVRLDGSTTDRDTPVKKFQAGKVPLFLISLKAGGTGLNLTAADTVIHYDPWWNPAVERQATDRAHRIGQDKKVFVYKLVTTGTVEEKILAMQERKKELVAGLLGEGAQENLQLSKDDLDHLFDPLA